MRPNTDGACGISLTRPPPKEPPAPAGFAQEDTSHDPTRATVPALGLGAGIAVLVPRLDPTDRSRGGAVRRPETFGADDPGCDVAGYSTAVSL